MSAFALPEPAQRALASWREAGETIVFTNGVFDLLHRGHVEYLEDARGLGDRLVVGVNGDASVRRLKGPTRPLVPGAERAELLAALACVDLVIAFDDDTPAALIEAVAPDVLVKEFVEARGGRVLNVPHREGLSTTAIVERIRAGKRAGEP
jgi:D-beta-D-heptose 7-phosphate kinase/D-beta-D-heptose 1-phosphate adenosyltransferase